MSYAVDLDRSKDSAGESAPLLKQQQQQQQQQQHPYQYQTNNAALPPQPRSPAPIPTGRIQQMQYGSPIYSEKPGIHVPQNGALPPQPRSPAPIPTGRIQQIQQMHYGATGSSSPIYPEKPGMHAPPPYDPKKPTSGSSYFMTPQHPPSPSYPYNKQQQQQLQQNPVLMHPPAPYPLNPYYLPFPAPPGGAIPPQYKQQYQTPPPPIYQQQQAQPRIGTNGPFPTPVDASHSATASGSLPALNDIFNEPPAGGKESQPPTGYGGGSPSTSPRIYDVPIQPMHRLPPSGRATNQQQNVVGRTNSNSPGELSSKRSTANKGGKDHRRTHSDSPLLRKNQMHRRAYSGDLLPPIGGGHTRARSLSGGNPMTGGRPRHRRADSANSFHSMGGGSYGGSIADSSMVSMRTNIAKSSMFGGVDQEGRPLLYFPYEAIRLVMIPGPKNQTKNHPGRSSKYPVEFRSDEDTAETEDHLPLTIGQLYAHNPVNSDQMYEEYYRISDELELGLTPQWESLDIHPLKSKQSVGGGTDEGVRIDKQELLPPTNYVLAVSDDVYRRMLSEVSSAQTMPCGLFFCGHHEDVDYPSVWIPGTLVIILLGTLLFLSYYTGG